MVHHLSIVKAIQKKYAAFYLPAYVTKEVKNRWICTSRPLHAFIVWKGTSRLAILQSTSNTVRITGPILAKLGKTGPHGQLHDQLNHCQFLSKRVSSTMMPLTCIRKVCSSNFGRRTDSTDVSLGFTQSFLEISPGNLLLYHAGFTIGDLPPNVLLSQFISSVVK